MRAECTSRAGAVLLVLVSVCLFSSTLVTAWFGFGSTTRKDAWDFDSVRDGMKQLYNDHVAPAERYFRYAEFYSPPLLAADFDTAPLVLLLGQYSVGKTSFIRYLLQRDFAGMHIGPEPTTDRFHVLFHGVEERVIPGNALAVRADLPFTPLQQFGVGFLNKLSGTQIASELLRGLVFVDTPGVLSGEKQTKGRSFVFERVAEWFAERASMVILMFDAHKLDISDEFNRTIASMRKYDDKIRIILNKADTLNTADLMKVYGALMWSLGRVFEAPEVPRVYIGSFANATEHRRMPGQHLLGYFDEQVSAVVSDIVRLPRAQSLRQVNEIAKRISFIKCLAFLLDHLKDATPRWIGKAERQKELLEHLDDVYSSLARRHALPASDFPDQARFRSIASSMDFRDFPSIDLDLIARLDTVRTKDIPNLTRAFPEDDGIQYRTLNEVPGVVMLENPRDVNVRVLQPNPRLPWLIVMTPRVGSLSGQHALVALGRLAIRRVQVGILTDEVGAKLLGLERHFPKNAHDVALAFVPWNDRPRLFSGHHDDSSALKSFLRAQLE